MDKLSHRRCLFAYLGLAYIVDESQEELEDGSFTIECISYSVEDNSEISTWLESQRAHRPLVKPILFACIAPSKWSLSDLLSSRTASFCFSDNHDSRGVGTDHIIYNALEGGVESTLTIPY